MADALGWRCKFGVVVPSTNTIVQPDFDRLAPHGVTNHVGRIAIPNMALNSDEDFDTLVRLSAAALDEAVDRVMTAAPDFLIVGMSSLLVWDGYEAAERRRSGLETRTGLKVTGGSFAVAAALERLRIKRIGILSPYMPVADGHITRFFEAAGFTVKKFLGLRCPSPVLIAHTPAGELRGAIDEVDSDQVEAIVQFGTNLAMIDLAAEEEQRRGKPVLAINPVSYWHALRKAGLDDKVTPAGAALAGL